MTTTVAKNVAVAQGVGRNIPESRFIQVVGTASDIADDGSVAIVFPELIGKAGMVTVLKAWTYGAGPAPGARTATNLPVINTGSALVGIEETTFAEATGTLTLVNRSGAQITTLYVLVLLFPDVTVPS